MQTWCFSCRQSSSIIIFDIEVKKPDDCDSGIGHHFEIQVMLGSLSKSVFEQCTLTESEVISILKHLDATKFVFLRVFTIIDTDLLKNWGKITIQNWKKTTSSWCELLNIVFA